MKSFRDFIFEQIGRKRIVMLGGPGSGKSTYTEYLVKEYDITHIYPGGMLRKEVEKGSEIGKIAKSIIDRGEFVPNQIVLDLITKKVEQSPQGYVLDGWPRYMQQVEDMEKNEIGYDYAASSIKGKNTTKTNKYLLKRSEIIKSDSLSTIIKKINGYYDYYSV